MQRIIRGGSLIALLLIMIGTTPPDPAAAQSARQTWAFYFGWYDGANWGSLNDRLIDRPAIGDYDSRDAGTIQTHINQAQSAGIDAFVMSWYGPADGVVTTTTLDRALNAAAAAGFRIGVNIDMCCGYNSTVEQVSASIADIVNHRGNHPAYLRWNGKPVIYFWNQARFSPEQWAQIRAQVDPGRATIWVAEGAAPERWLPTFDGLYLFNVAWSAPNWAGTAARWRDATYAAGGTFYTPTAHPGWDESRLPNRPNAAAPIGRDGGATLRASFAGAASAASSGVVLIVSWNEWLENSHIEPSQVYGEQSLNVLREIVPAWESGGTIPAAPGGSAPVAAQPAPVEPVDVSNAPPPGGVTITLPNPTNFRDQPSLNSGIITEVPFTTTLAVRARTADSQWVLVDYNGQTGWIAAWVVTVAGDLGGVPVVE